MKRFLPVFLITSVASLFLSSCGQIAVSDIPPTPILISLVSASPAEAFDLMSPTSKPILQQNISNFTYADLADTMFVFCGGAGAWSTEVRISSDGTFNGYYSDLDMGDSNTNYPNGTQYECFFSGKFSDLKKSGECEYTMKCESLTQEGTVNEEKVKEDGLRYITSDPYGFDKADEFIIYLPGKSIDELPVEYAEWVGLSQHYKNSDKNVLPFYGLYNVSGKEGFSSQELKK